ncbi:MAG: thioesterase family protein [Acidimicrobiia bacterium]
MTYEFSRDTSLERTGSGTWRGEVADGWDVAGVPNGGYIMALMLTGMLGEVEQPDPLTTTTHFLAPPRPGLVGLHTHVAKSGRRYSTVRGDLLQDDRIIATSIVMAADLALDGRDVRVDVAPHGYPSPESCRVATRTGPGSVVAVLDRVEIRMAPDLAGFATGNPSGEAAAGGWARFADGRPIDTRSLTFFADTFAPPILNLGLEFAWVPTLELTVHVRRRPATEWVAARFSSHVMMNGHLEEDGVIWDEDGSLIAQSRQIAVLPASS